jgi:hypothetical protein
VVSTSRWLEPGIQALETVVVISETYRIPTSRLKPCVAVLMAGRIDHTHAHRAAFTIAIELRDLGWSQLVVEDHIARWGIMVGRKPRDVVRAVHGAFAQLPTGAWKYRPPGLGKVGPTYQSSLKPICDQVDCPAMCPPFIGRHRGAHSQTFQRFCKLGWRKELRTVAAVETYRAICIREKDVGFAPGEAFCVSLRQLAVIAGHDHKTVRRCAARLDRVGLIDFEPGSGSGPHARDRKASRVSRIVPIPSPSGIVYLSALTTDGSQPLDIGGRWPPLRPRKRT